MNWNYNAGQNSCATNATARQNEAFSLPPPPRCSVDVMHSSLFQHNQHCLGKKGTVEIGSYNNIPKLFKEVEYELI